MNYPSIKALCQITDRETAISYAGTIIKIGDRFRVGCWGDIVERGDYA